MKYITLGKPRIFDEIKKISMLRILKSYNHGKQFDIFAVYLKETNHFIGWFQFKPDKFINDAIKIGWRLKKEY